MKIHQVRIDFEDGLATTLSRDDWQRLASFLDIQLTTNEVTRLEGLLYFIATKLAVPRD